jgi:ribosomal protein L37AE/L43A
MNTNCVKAVVDDPTLRRIFAAVENSHGEFSPLCPVCKRWHVERLGGYAKLHRCRDCGFAWAEYQVDALTIEELCAVIEKMQVACRALMETPLEYSELITRGDSQTICRATRILTKQINQMYKQLAAMLNAVEPREQDHSGADWNAH